MEKINENVENGEVIEVVKDKKEARKERLEEIRNKIKDNGKKIAAVAVAVVSVAGLVAYGIVKSRSDETSDCLDGDAEPIDVTDESNDEVTYF